MSAIELILNEGCHVEAKSPLATHPVSLDVPKALGGGGAYMNPTDLFGVSLGSCILITMNLLAQKMRVDLKGTSCKVTKMMELQPELKITGTRVEIQCPDGIDPEVQKKLEDAAHHCPVHKALKEEIKQEVVFHWGAA